MFEYVRLKNFKAFDDITFDLRDKKGRPKQLVLIYGENGIGKSNLASAFFMIAETLRTMDVRDIVQSLLEANPKTLNDEEFSRIIKMRYKDIETLISENKTVASKDPMYLEFGFQIDGKSGRYILESDNSQIIHERLEYTLSRNRGTYYDITPHKASISPKIFMDRASHQDVSIACAKYWGKHSFLSILLHESNDKSDEYISAQISDNFCKVLDFFTHLSCKIKFGSRQERGIIGLPPEIFGDLESGIIPIQEEDSLNRTEEMLNLFFKYTYRDIESAYYKRTRKEGTLRYQLMIRKLIAGESKDIDFSLESTGTQSLIQQLPFMLVVVKGAVAVIDEFDTGIHDILVQNLITSLNNNINGQLIMTTHNTLLMESNLPKESIYVINELPGGEREIQCITRYGETIYPNTNIRDRYMLGKYKGIPEKIQINFTKLISTLETKE